MVSESSARQAWLFILAASASCILGAAVVFLDVLAVRCGLTSHRFNLMDSPRFLSATLALTAGTLLFTSLYLLLPEARDYLAATQSFGELSDLALMALYFSGALLTHLGMHWMHRATPHAIAHTHEAFCIGADAPMLSDVHCAAVNETDPLLTAKPSSYTANTAEVFVSSPSASSASSASTSSFLSLGKATRRQRRWSGGRVHRHHRPSYARHHSTHRTYVRRILPLSPGSAILSSDTAGRQRHALPSTHSSLPTHLYTDYTADRCLQSDSAVLDAVCASASEEVVLDVPGWSGHSAANALSPTSPLPPFVPARLQDDAVLPHYVNSYNAQYEAGAIDSLDRAASSTPANVCSSGYAADTICSANYTAHRMKGPRAARPSFPPRRLSAPGSTYYARTRDEYHPPSQFSPIPPSPHPHQHMQHVEEDTDTIGDYHHPTISPAVAIQTALAVTLHKMPEGMMTFLGAHASTSLGWSLVATMMIHNIPDGLAISVPVYAATGSRLRAFLTAALLGGLAQPLGALVSVPLVYGWYNNEHATWYKAMLSGCSLSIGAGMMTAVAVLGAYPAAVSGAYAAARAAAHHEARQQRTRVTAERLAFWQHKRLHALGTWCVLGIAAIALSTLISPEE